MSNEYLYEIRNLFKQNENNQLAKEMKQNINNKFDFFGIEIHKRKEITNAFVEKNGLPTAEILDKVIHELWELPKREYQYFALDLLELAIEKYTLDIVPLCEYLIVNKSWWDTVDDISANILGAFFKKRERFAIPVTTRWINSSNEWLKRSALLFQVNYGEGTDTKLLFKYIEECLDNDSVTVAKGIKKALKEYAKVDEVKVRDFIIKKKLENILPS